MKVRINGEKSRNKTKKKIKVGKNKIKNFK